MAYFIIIGLVRWLNAMTEVMRVAKTDFEEAEDAFFEWYGEAAHELWRLTFELTLDGIFERVPHHVLVG